MARIAEKLADVIYVTSDNPRTEDPRSILNEITAGFTPENESANVYLSIWIVALPLSESWDDAKPGDVVLIAGKGLRTLPDHQRHQASFRRRRRVRPSAGQEKYNRGMNKCRMQNAECRTKPRTLPGYPLQRVVN